MEREFCEIGESAKTMEEAATILMEAFAGIGKNAWPTIEEAAEEVRECVQASNLCIGIRAGGVLAGWVGLRPMYEKTWELHHLAIRKDFQGKGLGRLCMARIEELAAERGLIGIALGADDETGRTSLSRLDLDGNSILSAIANIENLGGHPFEFYRKCGYAIVGVIPDANGPRRPDIWMWKKLEKRFRGPAIPQPRGAAFP